MPGPDKNRHATRWIVDRVEILSQSLRGRELANVEDTEALDLAAERLRELNALAAKAYVGIPPAAYCAECGLPRASVYRLHVRYVALQVASAKLRRKLVIRAAKLGRERAAHDATRRELEAVAIDHAVHLEAGIRLARQMMNTPGQGLVGALMYRTLGGKSNVQQ